MWHKQNKYEYSKNVSLIERRELLLAATALFHPLLKPVLLRLDILGHKSVALFHFFVGTLDHTLNNYLGLCVKFIELHAQMAGVVSRVHIGRLGRGLLLLDEFERMRVGEERGEFLLEMVGLARVLVDVVLDSDLDGKGVTL